MLKLVHVSRSGADPKIFTPVFLEALAEFGELELVDNGDDLSDAEKAPILRKADVAMTGWSSSPLPEGHEAREWPNCIFSAHHIGRDWPTHGEPSGRLQPMHRVCLDNLDRYVRGKPLRFVMDATRFARST